VVLGAQARYDIGLYFGVDGDPNNNGALTGLCSTKIILPGEEVPPSTFVNLDNPGNVDPQGDLCGDIDAAHNPQLLNLTLSVACVGDPVTGKLKLPNCTSWRQPGSNEVCKTANDAFPGSPSKCNCQPGFTIDIRVATPTIAVAKVASPTSVDEPGGDVTFSVSVTNQGTIPVVITSLVDDTYGDLNGQGDCVVPQTIQPGAANAYHCSFVGAVSGNAGEVKTDEVCASGHDNQTPPGDVGPTCDTADVTIGGVPSSATLAKTVDSADVTYRVLVTNTSTVDTLTLTRLCDDKFGDISGNGSSSPACAAGSATLVSTTCPSLPVPNIAAAGGKVECTFVGRITSSNTDTVGGQLNDNDGNTLTPSDSATVTITP
jgi:hypothetical protein